MPEGDPLLIPMDTSRMGIKVKSDQTLAMALLAAAHKYGAASPLIHDPQTPKPLSYAATIARAWAFARVLGRNLAAEETTVGLLMPTSVPAMISFFGVQFLGRCVTMLNFTSGAAAVIGGCQTATVRTAISSRLFIERANLSMLVQAMEDSGIRVLFMEDLEAKTKRSDRLSGFLSRLSKRAIKRSCAGGQPNDPAVILFTSGSEGKPKGVALSHKNLLANIMQFTRSIDVGAWDRMFACLPVYHSFGLNVGVLLPMMTGMQTYLYPSPLHYHDVPKLIRETQSTLLLSTDTFLTGYARTGKKEDFASLRYIVPGAEKAKDRTHRIWRERFGKLLFEGYGVTETAPVISVNSPEAYRPGTSGKLMPGLDAELRPLEGIADGGELWVRGPNVMLGYIDPSRPGVIVPLKDGWHNTGDVAALDAEGFLAIKGRLRRFAKIGGEMISLIAVEQSVATLWPDRLHVAVTVPHPTKGESIVLLTEEQDADADVLRHDMRAHGVPEIAIPKKILRVANVPVLGSGKIDFVAARLMALQDAEDLLPEPQAAQEKIA